MKVLICINWYYGRTNWLLYILKHVYVYVLGVTPDLSALLNRFSLHWNPASKQTVFLIHCVTYYKFILRWNSYCSLHNTQGSLLHQLKSEIKTYQYAGFLDGNMAQSHNLWIVAGFYHELWELAAWRNCSSKGRAFLLHHPWENSCRKQILGCSWNWFSWFKETYFCFSEWNTKWVYRC